MPVLPRLIALLTVSVLVGCVSDRVRPPQEFGRDHEEADTDSIEIEVGSSSGIYGGPTYNERWVLGRNGECKGTLTSGSNAGDRAETTVVMELRSEEKYRECQRLLRETRFFWMRDREPKTRFENSTVWIEVHAGLRQHRVRVVSPESSPVEFTRITEFVSGLREKAKEVKN